MAIDGFLKLPDIAGESVRERHEDEIEIHDLQFSMGSVTSASSARRGRVTLEPITVRKHYDRSSPYLKKMLHDGRHVREATISLARRVDGDASDYLVIVLTDASVVSYELSTTEDGLVQESLSLGYRRIRFVYDGEHEVELERR